MSASGGHLRVGVALQWIENGPPFGLVVIFLGEEIHSVNEK
jgi:hypothetical protein